VHSALRDFKSAALAEGAFFSSRGLRQVFAKYYFNNPTHVALPQSSIASCLGIVSLEGLLSKKMKSSSFFKDFFAKNVTFLDNAKCNEKMYCFGEARHPLCSPENYHERSKNFPKIAQKNQKKAA
jgi:hypothetical protein